MNFSTPLRPRFPWRSLTFGLGALVVFITVVLLPLPVGDIAMTELCAEDFCVSFPALGGLAGITQSPASAGIDGPLYPDYRSALLIDDKSGRACPGQVPYSRDSRCQSFTADEGYSVGIRPAEGPDAKKALAAVRKKLTPDVFTNVHSGTFAGQPAVFSVFHTREGGSGPYVDVYHNGRVYSIWAQGQTGGVRFAKQFHTSFRFTG